MNPTPPPTSRELPHLLAGARCILLDFDGPMCAVFAGLPARQVAQRMRDRLTQAAVPFDDSEATDDPMVLLARAASSPQGQRLAEHLLQAAEADAIATAAPTVGAVDLVRNANDSDRLVVIVSNNSAPAIRAYLDHHGITPHIHHVVGRDPNDATLMKPDPHLVQIALRLADTRPEQTVFVGDSVSDVAAGLACHVPVIGYANKPHKEAALADAGAAAVVTSLRPVVEALTAPH
ncbi:MAG: HAD family hydrolase [Actinomycetales bacterium]